MKVKGSVNFEIAALSCIYIFHAVNYKAPITALLGIKNIGRGAPDQADD